MVTLITGILMFCVWVLFFKYIDPILDARAELAKMADEERKPKDDDRQLKFEFDKGKQNE